MTIQFPNHAKLSIWALLALSFSTYATQQIPMVGKPVERNGGRQFNANSSTVVPVVVGGDVGTTAAAATKPITVTPSTVAAVATPAQAPTPQIERLSIQAGQRLSMALAAWLKPQDISLSWEPAGTLPGRVRDVVIDSAWLASQTALEPTLSEVLAPFGLTAHVLRQRQTTDASNATILDSSPTSVVVRNASNARP